MTTESTPAVVVASSVTGGNTIDTARAAGPTTGVLGGAPALRRWPIVSLVVVSTPERLRRRSSGADVTLASLLDHAPNYRTWIVDLCAPHLVETVLEVRAVPGSVSASSDLLGDATVADGLFGSAVMVNVLERIEDDQGVLREVLDRLEPGGRLCIWSPTYEFLFSPFDSQLGHVRRYRKRQLEADVRLAGFEVVEGRHVNLPGWLGWLVFCRLLRQDPTSPALLRLVDTWMVPAVRWFETRVRIPIGMSVFLVARKPA
jgi:SAM-dependent methyltransferase